MVFVSPSRNLRCGVVHFDGPATWGCSIVEKDWEFPSESPEDYCYEAHVPCGWGIEATGDGMPHPRMRGDVAFESESRVRLGRPPIRHVRHLLGRDVHVEERGITCENTQTGHGFTISRSLNEIW